MAFCCLQAALTVAHAAPAAAIGGFTFAQWGALEPPSSRTIGTGDFSGDGREDVLTYDPASGMVGVATSTGSSFTVSGAPWETLDPAAAWQLAPGHFDGDGLMDVAGYHPSDGSVWIGTNAGASFSFGLQRTITPAAGWKLLVGDFGGGTQDDVALYHVASGEIWIGTVLDGQLSSLSIWLILPGGGEWTLTVGNFVEGVRCEIGGFQQGVGALHVATSNGSALTLHDWRSSLAPGPAWGIHAGDYDLDGVDDLFAYDPTTGQNHVGRSMGTRFDFSLGPWGPPVGPPGGWQFDSGDFDGDGDVDAVGYASVDDTLWFTERVHALDGIYAWPLSAAPGESIDFMASGATETTVEFFRHTSFGPSVDSVLMASTTYVPTNQPTQAEPWRNGAGWAPSFRLTLPAGWPSGYYSARITGLSGEHSHAPFIVKAPNSAAPTIALLANVTTWLAYNRWDGSSPGSHGRYTGESDVSHLRPNPWADPTAWGLEPSHLTRAELWIHSWLESEGYAPHVFTDLDFHNGEVGSGYEYLVIGTHPEYYTVEMYGLIQDHLDAGGSLLYLGGNGIFSITSFIPGTSQTRMEFLDGVQSGPRAPTLFRNQGWDAVPPAATLAERSLLGVATEACGVAGSPYAVLQPDHPIYAGAGVALDDQFGASGWNTVGGQFDGADGGLFNGKACGFEVDTTGGPGALGCPDRCSCGPAEVFPTPPSSLPGGLVVIARCVEPAGAPAMRGEATYYEHPGGGHVLSIGSITVGGSLLVDPVLQQIVRNALAPSATSVPALSPGARIALGILLLSVGLATTLTRWAARGRRA